MHVESLESRQLLTSISIASGKFYIDGQVTHAGTALQGMLPNIRMANAIADDANPATRSRWDYPDTGSWDPLRNTNEFAAAVPTYRANGLLAVNINLQGGWPDTSFGYDHQPLVNTAFNADGSLKPAYMDRLETALRALDRNGMVAFLGLFYFGQDQRLSNEQAVKNAVDNAVDWLVEKNITNVIIEVANECSQSFWQHSILRMERIHELFGRIRQRAGNGRFPITASFGGGWIPTTNVANVSDVILLHGNGQSDSRIAEMISRARARAPGKPIVFNEDSHRVNRFDIATQNGASWGYYELGANNYRDGYQLLPINYGINTTNKRAFFDRLRQRTTRPPVGTTRVSGFVLIDADRDRVIGTISDGQTINPAALGVARINIAAITEPAVVGSVRFGLDGVSNYRTEGAAPYALGGDTNGNYNAVRLSAGSHTVSATPFSASGGGGTAGTSKTIRFTLSTGTSARSLQPQAFGSARLFSGEKLERSDLIDTLPLD